MVNSMLLNQEHTCASSVMFTVMPYKHYDLFSTVNLVYMHILTIIYFITNNNLKITFCFRNMLVLYDTHDPIRYGCRKSAKHFTSNSAISVFQLVPVDIRLRVPIYETPLSVSQLVPVDIRLRVP
jgi:hypothetical protein